MRIILRMIPCVLALTLTFQSVHAGDPCKGSEATNVLFIICDDLNDYQGAFGGHPQVVSPNIDKLAGTGVVFSNAHTNSPVCVPSRNSLFSGIYPHKLEDFVFQQFHPPKLQDQKMLMELFAENGWYILGSGKLLHTKSKQYFEEWGIEINNYGPFPFNGHERVGHPSVPLPMRSNGSLDGTYAPLSDIPAFPDSISIGKECGWVYTNRGKPQMFRYEAPDDRDLMPDELHAQWAAKRIRELDKKGSGKPFFMGIGFMRPHTPLVAPERFFNMFPVDSIRLPQLMEGDAEDTHYRNLYPPSIQGLKYFRDIGESYGGDTELGLKHFIRAYLACIAFVDEQVGIVLNALEESSFKDNTIIIFTSDHGWHMGEKDYLFKNSPWEESTRIPLIIKLPGMDRSALVTHPVSLVDLYPTLIDLCGLEGNNRKTENGLGLDGSSLKPLLENPNAREWDGPPGVLTMLGSGLNPEDPVKQTYSYRTKDWRYILYLEGSEELYHNESDPFEWNNLADDPRYGSVKNEMRKGMMELLDYRND